MWQYPQTQILAKLRLSNYDKTQKLKVWQNRKTKIVTTQTVTKLKKLNFYNSKTPMLQTQNVTKQKNSNRNITQKLKIWQNTKYQIGTKLENSNGDYTQKLKLWQNSET